MAITTDPQPLWLEAVHSGLRRDLAAFASAAAGTPLDDRRAWRTLARRWELLMTVLEALARGQTGAEPRWQACAAGFDRLAETPDGDARAALVVRLVASRQALGRSLADDETQHAVAARQSPPRMLRTVPWLTYRLPRDTRAHLLGRASVRSRLVWRLTSRRFHRSERRIFRYATC
jgi:hypothetical protein